MQMNLFENIKIFIEIVDAGSFAQAAEHAQIHSASAGNSLQHSGAGLLHPRVTPPQGRSS
ncbi:hypothetical protein G6003_24855 [Klebsiella pneumoniae]|nr:hypothetical protein [Klebsiella pneumoniae]